MQKRISGRAVDAGLIQRVELMLSEGSLDPQRLRGFLDFEEDLAREMGLKPYVVPVAGDVLFCRFSTPGIGNEIFKFRPVIVLSPKSQRRSDLYIVVALSTVRPNPEEPIHLAFPRGSISGLTEDTWLKGDTLYQVSRKRLERVKTADRKWIMPKISKEALNQVHACVLHAIGLNQLTSSLVAAI